MFNEWLRDESSVFADWDVGGQIRGRYESKSGIAVAGTPNAVDFSRLTPDNRYWLLRETGHVGWRPDSWIRLYGETRDSRTFNDKRSPHPEYDVFDLHQAYLGLGDPAAFPVTAQIGRQEMVYGDSRLVGLSDWNNIGKVFDAAKLRFESGHIWVDAFASRIVVPRNDTVDTVNDYDWFSGVYASSKALVPNQETQVYFFARNVGAASPAAFPASPPPLVKPAGSRDIYTAGWRVKSTPGNLQGWDYTAELASQFGDYYDANATRRLNQEALAAHASIGYTFEKTVGKPRLALAYNFSSGDGNPADGTHGTFDSLFPSNHSLYGFMDLVCWQNLHNAHLTIAGTPLQDLTFVVNSHFFWLASTSDYFYSVNGLPRTTGGYGIHPANDSFVGSEFEFMVNYRFKKFAGAQAGYGHFFRGRYVEQSLAATGSKDANWVYCQLTFNF